MENISGEPRALETLIDGALSLDPAIAVPATRSLFSNVIEPLADRFEPSDCEAYARLFSGVLERVFPQLEARQLEERYRRIRQVRPVRIEPKTVYVLSRVTLGADIAVTSVVLDAAKRRFPNARICFAGSLKCAELFAGDARILHCALPYPRGGALRERLANWRSLRELLADPDGLVLDPDSRLTQLGLLPAGDDGRYHFFESRSYGGDGPDSLPALTRRWTEETLGVAGAQGYICTGLPAARFAATVSLGVGENLSKRVEDPFEEKLLRRLPQPLLIDRGAGGEEAARVERAVARSGVAAEFWEGSFAGFAQHIAHSGLYAGYDSAGGHAAAACGVPLMVVFKGALSDRMFQRWRPSGPGPIRVIRADGLDAGGLDADEVLRGFA